MTSDKPSPKFPDEAALEVLYVNWQHFRPDQYRRVQKALLEAALADYHHRTGIDLADVSEKLAAKTHVLVPVEPTEEMLDIMAGTKWSNLPDSKKSNEVIAYRAMIRAAK